MSILLVFLYLASSAVGAEQCGWNPSNLSPLERSTTCPLPIDASVGLSPESWTPWTHRPYCARSRYCVFTNAMLPPRDGISLIATPELAANRPSHLEQISDISFPDPSKVSTTSEPLYEVKDVLGKGKGAIARREIAKDMVIMIDHAIMLSMTEYPGDVLREQVQDMLQRGAEQLRNPARVFGLGQKGTAGASVVEDIFITNSFALSIDGVSYAGLFPELSRLNHDCNPNAVIYFSEKKMAMVVWSSRDIKPGDEITISYLHTGFTYAERQKTTADLWGFECKCPLCSHGLEHRIASDKRRKLIRSLRGEIVQAINSGNFTRAVKVDEELLELVEMEGMMPFYGDYFEIAAQLHNIVGNLGKAQNYTEIIVDELQRYGWPGVDDAAKIAKYTRLLRRIQKRRMEERQGD